MMIPHRSWQPAVRVPWAMVTALTVLLSTAAFLALLDRGAAEARFDQGPLALKPALVDELIDLGVLSDDFITAGDVSIRLVGMLLFAVTSAVIVWRRSGGWMPLLVSATLLTVGASLFAPLEVLERSDPAWRWPIRFVGILSPADPRFWRSLAGILLVLFLCLFPSGRFVPRWSAALAAAIAALGVLWALFPGSPAAADRWSGPARFAWSLGIPLAAGAAQVYRYARVADSDQRRQTRLVVFAFATAAAILLVIGTVNPQLEEGVGSLVVATPRLRALYDLQLLLVLTFALFLFPVSIAVSVVRYRLLDIDIVVSRTLLYGALAGFIGAVYVVVVVVVGNAAGTRGRPNAVLSIATLAIVAVAFDPVRQRVQRFANRLVYGERATPYEVMADFTDRVAETLSVEDVLPRMAEAAAKGVGARAGQVTLFIGSGEDRSVSWPEGMVAPAFDRVIPVTHRGEAVGEIGVAKRPGYPLTAAEEDLLAALAAQAGPALHNVALNLRLQTSLAEIAASAEALRASRRRIVHAREDALRRLSSAVHDRVETPLARTTETLAVAERIVVHDPETAVGRLEAASEEAGRALEALRDLARGIFPPILADRGLAAALSAHIDKSGDPVDLEVDDVFATTRFDPQIEASLYFCAVLGLRHAAAAQPGAPVVLRLGHAEGEVTFIVKAAQPEEGPDLQLIADQAGALNGSLTVTTGPDGTTEVTARLPTGAPDQLNV